MKRSLAFAVLLLLIGLMSAQPLTEGSGQSSSDGWMTLLDGSTLDGWNVLGAVVGSWWTARSRATVTLAFS